jgi:hypothetical protein
VAANTDIVVRDINKVARYERQRGVLPPEEMAQLQGYKRQIVGAIKRGGKGTGSRSVLASVLGGLDHTWNKYAPKLFRRHELAYS